MNQANSEQLVATLNKLMKEIITACQTIQALISNTNVQQKVVPLENIKNNFYFGAKDSAQPTLNRIYNALQRQGFETLNSLAEADVSFLRSIKNLGKKSLATLIAICYYYDIIIFLYERDREIAEAVQEVSKQLQIRS